MEAYLEDNRPTLNEICEEYDECTEECPAYRFCHSEAERMKELFEYILIALACPLVLPLVEPQERSK